MDAISAEGLRKTFGPIVAVDQLSFRVAQAEVFSLLGPNGAGKTTMVRLLNGLLTPDAGRAQVLGIDPRRNGPQARRVAGVLTENPSLYERLTARENLRFFAVMYSVNPDRIHGRVEELLRQFDLISRENDPVGGFSRGMKQRLALARALLHDPEVLFLDEPTAGLDPEAAREVTQLIETLSRQRGRTILLCTHNLQEAQRLSDRVAVISHGRLLATGAVADLAKELWQAVWVDVQLLDANPQALAEELRSTPGVIAVNVSSAGLEVRVDSLTTVPRMVAAVIAGGGHVMRVSPREHTLEDVYFELERRAQGTTR